MDGSAVTRRAADNTQSAVSRNGPSCIGSGTKLRGQISAQRSTASREKRIVSLERSAEWRTVGGGGSSEIFHGFETHTHTEQLKFTLKKDDP